MDADLVIALVGADVQLLQKIVEGDRADAAVDHQPHRAVGAVGAHVDHRAREARVAHLRHGDQELAGQVGRGVFGIGRLVGHEFELVTAPIEGKGASLCATDYTLFCEFMGRAFGAPVTYNTPDGSTGY
jgi:hypothetical protein